jgi:hypothetical protein
MSTNEELEVLAIRKGFYLSILEDRDVVDFVGSKYVLQTQRMKMLTMCTLRPSWA